MLRVPVLGRLRSVPVLLLLLGALTGACPACDDDGATTGTGGGAQRVKTFIQSSCGRCVEEACAPQIEACTSDPSCTAYLDCLRGCPVDENGHVVAICDQGCSPGSSSEATRVQAELIECRLYGTGAACADCGVPAPPFDPSNPQQCAPPDPALVGCAACYAKSCCATYEACYGATGEPECDALATCILGCATSPLEPCMQACLMAHPVGAEPLFAQIECAVSHCVFDQKNCDASLRDPCEECFYVSCGSAWAELLSEAEGYLLAQCMLDCGDAGEGPACLEACFGAHPTAEAAGLLWAECVSFTCDTVC